MKYNFTTDIEKRMPHTGNVYGVDRMTSDYALAHPFDIDGFMESVWQEFAGTEYERSREDLHRLWNDVLGCKNPCGDKSLYPNRNGRREPALMKVWLKAGEYWRKGLRLGDVLPDMVPMHTVTRINGGVWVALFPKDMHFLSEECRVQSGESSATGDTSESAVEPIATESVLPAASPQEEAEEARQREERLLREATRQRREEQQREADRRRVEQEAEEAHQRKQGILKFVGGLVAATVACIIIWNTGLLIPLGLIGLATGGLLK